MRARLEGKHPISLLLAIPDHPWTKSTKDAAAVRIAMTVASNGEHVGQLREVIREDMLDTDEPVIDFADHSGHINADLTIGTDVTSATPLLANEGLCSPGVKLHGAGFIVTPEEAEHLGLGTSPGLDQHIRPYRHGRDILQTSRGVMVIDLDGLQSDEVRRRYPEVYQHILTTVKPERDHNNEEYRRLNWWLFGRRNTLYRGFKEGLTRYIATAETAKHRIFVFLDGSIVADNMVVNFGSDDAYALGVVSARVHVVWALRAGGWLGVGNDPRYSKSKIFDPFPFPSPGDLLKSKIRSVAEELDAFRKERQKEHPDLTLTQMYNVLEKLKSGEALNAADEAIKDKGLILILKEHHEKIDALVFEAYGWPQTLTDEEILERLVALNPERAAEEKRGHVRWLRPDYQIPRFGKGLDKMAAKEEQIEAALGIVEAGARKVSFPTDAVGQTAAVFAALAASKGTVTVADIAAGFRKSKNLEKMVAGVLASLTRLGHVSTRDGKTFELRRAA